MKFEKVRWRTEVDEKDILQDIGLHRSWNEIREEIMNRSLKYNKQDASV